MALGLFKSRDAGVIGDRRRGFTIVEVLVAVAIISLLVGILFPALNHARNVARAASCASNLREVGRFVAMYRVDRTMSDPWLFQNGSADYPHEGTSGSQPGNPAKALVGSYLDSPDILFCPIAPVSVERYDPSGESGYWGTYVYHYPKVPAADEPLRWARRHENEIQDANAASDKLLMMDSETLYWESEYGPRRTIGRNDYNALFLDGSVKRAADDVESARRFLWGKTLSPFSGYYRLTP